MQNSPFKVFSQPATGAKAKELEAARNACMSQLQANANDAQCMHIIGLIECQLGRAGSAREWFGKALVANPHAPDLYSCLGLALMEQKEIDEAISSFRRALALAPHHTEALYHLGRCLCETEQNEEAMVVLQRVIELKPDYVEALNCLGNCLCDQGLAPEALGCFRRALEVRPDYVMAHNNLGLALVETGAFGEAEAHYRQAVALKPDYAEAYNNLGIVYMLSDRFDESLACYQKALALRRDYPEARNNFGNVLKETGKLDEAIEQYERALRLRSADATYAHNLALAHLAAGQFDDGWRGYEQRWETPIMAATARHFSQPQWRGEAADGRTLLIHAEQGLGDALMFCRYAPMAKKRGFRVIIEAPSELGRLLKSLEGVDEVVARGETLPPFDMHCPMLSLPLAFGTAVNTVPAEIPYLSADPAAVKAWQEKMRPAQGKWRVGLVWAGLPRAMSQDLIAANRRRSLPAEALFPLLSMPGVDFYSLQKDVALPPASLGLVDHMAECVDFADTAALVANLDLIISVDTAMVHLAGAMGKPVWMLNRFNGCWRWMQGREDSPWYPQLRVFRQSGPGAWADVIENVRGALAKLAFGPAPN